MSIPTAYLDKLLKCAVSYHHKKIPFPEPIPDTHATTEEFIKVFQKSMEFEAHVAFQESIPKPADQTLYPVNISTKEPAIFAGIDDKKKPILYAPTKVVAGNPMKERAKADKMLDKWVERQFKQQDKTKQRIESKKQKVLDKKQYAEATPDQKKVICEKRKADRVKKKMDREKQKVERDKRKVEKDKLKAEKEKLTAKKEDKKQKNSIATDKQEKKGKESKEEKEEVGLGQQEEQGDQEDQEVGQQDVGQQEVQGLQKDDQGLKDKMVTPPIMDGGASTVDHQNSDIQKQMSDTQSTKPKKKKVVKTIEQEEAHLEQAMQALDEFLYGGEPEQPVFDEVEHDASGNAIFKFYENPVTFNRSIGALLQCNPHPKLEMTLLHGKASPNVKLFHGPPGTGKTYRLISELIELSSRSPNERILICAQSNVGTANMFDRAIKRGIQGSLIMAPSKVPREIHVPQGCSNPNARIVFCTVASRNCYKLKHEAFETIFLDEAAQIIEAHLWGLLRSEVHTLYMAGDPDQLPALVSQEGEQLNHGRSMMERLMSIGFPAELLNVQRRMHPDIVAFPNKEFYGNQLQTEYKGIDCSLPAFKVVHVDGTEEKMGTSFCNRAEIVQIEKLVSELKQTFDEKDIVIITPYTGQLGLLRKQFKYVHTVDSFQGREASAIILSTVRAKNTVGFWKDYRRVNVALTRAKHVLRIVGNTHTWKKDVCSLSKLVL